MFFIGVFKSIVLVNGEEFLCGLRLSAFVSFLFQFKCCGMAGKSDWTGGSNVTSGNATASKIPASCCKTDNKNPTCVDKADNVFDVGCTKKFQDFVKNKLVLIGAIALAIAFLQILGIIFACCMMREIRGQYEVV